MKVKLDNFYEIGETSTTTFQKVFGKKNLGRVRYFGRTITKISPKKNKKIDEIKKQNEEKVTTLKIELDDIKQKVQGLEDIVKFMLRQTSPDMNIDEALSLLRFKQLSANSA
ncbi:hypothetical protein Ahy_B01g052868 [Arachis hypogaea]|uniref:Uncharacterized protein n=1 Tax=Arachis hypogaea TaxID=3818 RepID=A0A445AQQ3_ARAHY|nr:hypothetical protein Ahy_B01g052868 [Arachis hypogaea]